MLYYCVWPKDGSFLVDVPDKETAIKAATEEVGEPPSLVHQIPPGIFGQRIYFDGDDVDVDILPHVLDVFDELEDAVAPPALAVVQPIATCASEAEDDAGKVVRCELATLHAEDHKNGALAWPNERRASKVG